MSSGQRRGNAISRTIGKPFRFDDIFRLRRHLIRFHRTNLIFIHCRIETGTVQKRNNIFLRTNLSKQQTIPQRIIFRRIIIIVFQIKFFGNTRFFVLIIFRTADPHTDLSRCVTTEYGTFLDYHHLHAKTSGCKRSTESCHAAADNTKFGFYFLLVQRHIISSYFHF